jgi:hypothetical protein
MVYPGGCGGAAVREPWRPLRRSTGDRAVLWCSQRKGPHGRARSSRPGHQPPGLAGLRPGADDAELIAASRAEPEVFAAIFDRHAATIHHYAARRLGQAVADDVVGETFLVAFRRPDRYDLAYRDARPWLFGIATNVISRHRQAEVRFYRALARTGVDAVIDSPADEVVARLTATAAPVAAGSPWPGTTAHPRPMPS